MKLSMRPYRDEDDYWAIRAFLRDVYVRNGRVEHSWLPDRLDYWRYFGMPVLGDGALETDVFLWETPSGEFVAVLNSESRGWAYLQVDPRFRAPALEEEMLLVAEERLRTIGKTSGRPVLVVEAQDVDTMRTELLARRGYERKADWQVSPRTRDLSLPIPDAPLAAGYGIRAMRPTEEDARSRKAASWRAFHPDEPIDTDFVGSSYRHIECEPLYRRDLDLVAEDPTGEIAAFATVWYDDALRVCTFEPVGTAPEHRRKGLARAVIAEGMRRAHSMGAQAASVGGGGASNPAADALYAGMFAKEGVSTVPWLKYFDGKGD
jgi:GNAT superfamily N-acetyltransferase